MAELHDTLRCLSTNCDDMPKTMSCICVLNRFKMNNNGNDNYESDIDNNKN